MSLTCLHYLQNDDFLDLEALFLGFPIPSLLDTPSAAQHGALGDYQFASARHAGCTRTKTHDELARLLASFARRVGFSGVETTFSRIPHAGLPNAPGARGDIYFPSGLSPLDPRRPFVLDLRLCHIFTSSGRLRPSLLASVSRHKKLRYETGYHGRGIGFAPLPVSTFLGVGDRLAHFKVDASSPEATVPSSSPAFPGVDGKSCLLGCSRSCSTVLLWLALCGCGVGMGSSMLPKISLAFAYLKILFVQ